MKTLNYISLKKGIVFIFILCFFSKTNAQSPVLKTWLNIGYSQKIKIKKFKCKLGISQGIRTSDLVYNTRVSALTELGVSKKITDNYSLGISYRISYINKLKHRIAISNAFKFKLVKRLKIGLRLKYQAEFEKNTPFSQDIRLKTKLTYKANKDYVPYLFGEILYNNTYNYSNFNEFRLGIGFSADYKKKHIFDVMLMFSQDLNIENPRKSLVLGLEYEFGN